MAKRIYDISLSQLLDWVTANVYDPGHGMLGPPSWSVSSEGLLDHLVEQLGISKEEMGKLFDEARRRVHGEGVDE